MPGESNSNGGTGGTGGANNNGAAISPELQEFRTLIASLAREGTLSQREERLMQENAKLRDKRRQAVVRAETAEAKIGNGVKVLDADQAKEWDEFQSLKLTSKDIKAKLDDHTALSERLATIETAATHEDAAELIGVENAPALAELLKTRPNMMVVIEEKRVRQTDGTYVLDRVPMIKNKTDDKATPEPLVEFVEREFATFVPVLMEAPSNGEDNADGGSGNTGTSTVQRTERTTDAAPIRRLGQSTGTNGNAGNNGGTAGDAGGVRLPRRNTAGGVKSAALTDRQKEDLLEQKRQNPIYSL